MCTLASDAHGATGKRAPPPAHDGVVVALDEGWVEFAMTDARIIQAWLRDGSGKPLPAKGCRGDLTIRPYERPAIVVRLTPSGDHLKGDKTVVHLRFTATLRLRCGATDRTAALRWQLHDNRNLDDTNLMDGFNL